MAARKKTSKKKVTKKKVAKKAAPAKKAAKKASKKKVTKKVAKKTTKKKVTKKASKKKKVAKKPAAKKKTAKKKAPAKKASKKKVAKKPASKKKVSKKKVTKKASKKKAPAKKATKKKVAKKPAAKKKASTKKTSTKKAPVSKKAPKKVIRKKKEKKEILKAPKRVRPVERKRNVNYSEAEGNIYGVAPYKRKAGEDYMNDDQLDHFEAILLGWKTKLMEEVDRTVHHMQDEASNFPDPTDRATQESEFGLELRTRDRERKLIKKIEQTLKRIEEGDYGYCEETGEEIGLKRLEARPVATLSVEAQERRELAERQFRDSDDRYR